MNNKSFQGNYKVIEKHHYQAGFGNSGDDIEMEIHSLGQIYTFEALYNDNFGGTILPTAIDNKGDSNYQSQTVKKTTLKMMDTILFDGGFKPRKWIFTNLQGTIQFKDIKEITINDVIRAFLVNMNATKKNEFTNQDLMDFLASAQSRDKICFALVGNKRHFLNIQDLSDFKNYFQKGIDALQLFKIPCRDFQPYFYYHTVVCRNGIQQNIQTISITKMSHFVQDLNKKQVNSQVFEKDVQQNELELFMNQIMDVTTTIIQRIQAKNVSHEVQRIKITYLIDSNNYDPWFIGTEYCQVLIRNKAKTQESQFPNQIQKANKSVGKSVQNVNESFNKKSQSSRKQNRNENPQKEQNEYVDDSLIKIEERSIAESSFFRKTPNIKNRKYKRNTNSDMVQILKNLNDMSRDQQAAQEEADNVYELTNNQLITQDDLYRGLLQIGRSFGKEQSSQFEEVPFQPYVSITTDSNRKPQTANSSSTKRNQHLKLKMAGNITNQEKPYSSHGQGQQKKLREREKKIVTLFPKYLEKSGSKMHSKFLFGNESSEKVFKEYQRLRCQKDSTNPPLFANQGNKNTAYETSNSFFQEPKKEERSVFDIKLSDAHNRSYDLNGNKSAKNKHSEFTNTYFNQYLIFEQQKLRENQDLIQNQSLFYEIDKEVILTDGIQMFQNQSQFSRQHQLDQNQFHQPNSFEQISDLQGEKRIEAINCEDLDISPMNAIKYSLSPFDNKIYEQRLIENQQQQKQRKEEIEDQTIQLMNMGKSLQNIVLVDQSKIVKQFKNKILAEEQEKVRDYQEDIFTDKRRRLGFEEAKNFVQWRKTIINKIQNHTTQSTDKFKKKHDISVCNTQANNTSHNFNSQSNQKRCYTSQGGRRSKRQSRQEDNNQSSGLKMLEIKGLNISKTPIKNGNRTSQNMMMLHNPTEKTLQSDYQSRTHSSMRVKKPVFSRKSIQCDCRKFCREQTIVTINGISDVEICYIDRKNYEQGLQKIRLQGRETVLKSYHDKFGYKNIQGLYTAIQLKNIEMSNGNSSRSRAAVQHQSNIQSQQSKRKDISIDAQRSLRRSLESTSEQQDTARKYLVKVPVMTKHQVQNVVIQSQTADGLSITQQQSVSIQQDDSIPESRILSAQKPQNVESIACCGKFRRDIHIGKYNTTQEIFLSKVGVATSYVDEKVNSIEPFFEKAGIQFVQIKRNNLYFVFVSKQRQMLTSYVLELLKQTVQMIHDFCGGLDEELLRTNFILVYELIDEIIDYGHPQLTKPDQLRLFVHTESEKCYNGTMDYIWHSLKLDKLKLTDSVSERESEKSIQKNSNDVFVEIQEKVNAIFNCSGFAIYIKVSGIVLVKNYIHHRLNLKVQFNEELNLHEDNTINPKDYTMRKKVHISQIHDTINEQELFLYRSLAMFPPLGQSIAMQYQMDGNFSMLPVKLYPSFIPRHNLKKLELTLKMNCRLPTNMRCKFLKVNFQFPQKVKKVYFTSVQQPTESLKISDVKDMDSLNKVATQWISAAAAYTTHTSTLASENGIADVDMKKRKITWTLTNFKGGQNKSLEVSLSYDKDVLIDELQFKYLGPFTLDFDIPSYTASGIKITKLDAKLIDQPFDQKEPGKWLRHKTLSGSYVART